MISMRKKEHITQFATLNVYQSDFDKIEAICKALGIKKCAFMEKILEGVWDAASEFITRPKDMGILIDYRGNRCQLIFYGKSAVVAGMISPSEEIPEEDVDQMVAEESEEQFEERDADKLEEDKVRDEK